MTVLRVYDPAQCDERGVPLDWDGCRKCEGSGYETLWGGRVPPMGQPDSISCPTCDGHGSLKAAALAAAFERARRLHDPMPIVRCEGCGHPMSEGTWEGDLTRSPMTPAKAHLGFREGYTPSAQDWQARHLEAGWAWLCAGQEPHGSVAVHYSPCDEGCRHGGPGRIGYAKYECKGLPVERWGYGGLDTDPWDGAETVEASWRPVEVRTGVPAPPGHPHPMIYIRPWDLRPENLSVLCLRCWIERGTSAGR